MEIAIKMETKSQKVKKSKKDNQILALFMGANFGRPHSQNFFYYVSGDFHGQLLQNERRGGEKLS